MDTTALQAAALAYQTATDQVQAAGQQLAVAVANLGSAEDALKSAIADVAAAATPAPDTAALVADEAKLEADIETLGGQASTPVPTPTPTPTPVPTAPVANSVTVANAADLNEALAMATAGLTILLAPGQYDGVACNGVTVGGVTITSADPANPAVLTRFYAQNNDGVTFTNLEFSTVGQTDPYPFRINTCKNMALSNLSVHGDLAGDPRVQMTGLYLNSCDTVTIKNCELQKLLNGIVHGSCTNITITENHLHDLGSDGIDNDASSNVTISKNYIHDIYPADGSHPDAIQFEDAGATTQPSTLTVRNNLIARGAGGVAQGVFLGDEAGNGVLDVVIDGNLTVGCMFNGIAAANVINLALTNNTVLAFADQPSWIVLRGCTAPIVVTGNNATPPAGQAGPINYTDAVATTDENNTIIDIPADQGAAAIAAWQATFGAVYGIVAPAA